MALRCTLYIVFKGLTPSRAGLDALVDAGSSLGLGADADGDDGFSREGDIGQSMYYSVIDDAAAAEPSDGGNDGGGDGGGSDGASSSSNNYRNEAGEAAGGTVAPEAAELLSILQPGRMDAAMPGAGHDLLAAFDADNGTGGEDAPAQTPVLAAATAAAADAAERAPPPAAAASPATPPRKAVPPGAAAAATVASPFINKDVADAIEKDAADAADAVAKLTAERAAVARAGAMNTPDRRAASTEPASATPPLSPAAEDDYVAARVQGSDARLRAEAGTLAALATASDVEKTLVTEAFQVLLPAWQQRLAAAAGSAVQMDIDLEKMVWWCDTKGRMKVATALFKGGAISRPGLEVLVDEVEKCCSASPTSRSAFAAAVQAVEFVNTDPSASDSHKTIAIEDGVLIYRGPFMLGVNSGTFAKDELSDFFEAQFQPKEHKLLDQFDTALGQASMDLKTLLRADVTVTMDVRPMLGMMSQPNRIKLLKTLVSEFGRGYAIESKVKEVDKVRPLFACLFFLRFLLRPPPVFQRWSMLHVACALLCSNRSFFWGSHLCSFSSFFLSCSCYARTGISSSSSSSSFFWGGVTK